MSALCNAHGRCLAVARSSDLDLTSPLVLPEQQNNKQGMGFVIFGQLCSRRFSWQLFALVAAVLSATLGRMYEAMGMDELAR